MDTFYRATLRLEKIEPFIDSDSEYIRERGVETACITVSGDTPADAMVQLCAHADSLHDWHVTQADNEAGDEPMPLLDEAVKVGPPAFDLSKLFKDVFASPKRHRCTICGQPGPVLHEGDTYVCAPCNAVAGAPSCGDVYRTGGGSSYSCSLKPGHKGPHLDGAQGDVAWRNPGWRGADGEPGQEGAEAENDPAFVDAEADPLAHCHVPVDGGYCHRPYRHEGRCSTKGDPVPNSPAEAGVPTSPISEGEQQQ